MLASQALLSIFITTQGTGHVGKGAMQTWLEGLKLWHHINSAPWHGGKLLTWSVDDATRHAPTTSHLPSSPWPVLPSGVAAALANCSLTLTSTLLSTFHRLCVRATSWMFYQRMAPIERSHLQSQPRQLPLPG
jgi:hypothetical protein